MYNELTPIEESALNAKKKRDTWMSSKLHYFIKAMLAGVYIGFGIMVAYKTGEFFFDAGSPSAMMLVAIFFGTALVMIIYGGAELFTSNTMTMTIGTLKKETTWYETFQVWVACYFGNLAGALFFSLLIMLSGLFLSPDKSQLLMDVASYKMHGHTLEIFFRAILCNWLVCLAIWLPMHVKGDVAKLLLTLLLVFGFVISGYEHSIANMALFGIALMVPHPDTITIWSAIHNLIPVTFGNLIGGSIFVGAFYVYLNKKPVAKEKKVLENEVSFSVAEKRVAKM
ncbi:formate/nitrite transporter family protein [Robertmurraya korlensis]|uniref:formate/nitrite transporter family protein n=1 Tax=Robertmurraya korlensis TaxID=519977 RepID=UPI0020415B21|nr:formate/nitrite transporter family protein [Robertmurraya korlensis]MCM3601570.1 formate/nitrite transporter family protein [Robertmurraya korlensis]